LRETNEPFLVYAVWEGGAEPAFDGLGGRSVTTNRSDSS